MYLTWDVLGARLNTSGHTSDIQNKSVEMTIQYLRNKKRSRGKLTQTKLCILKTGSYLVRPFLPLVSVKSRTEKQGSEYQNLQAENYASVDYNKIHITHGEDGYLPWGRVRREKISMFWQ